MKIEKNGDCPYLFLMIETVSLTKHFKGRYGKIIKAVENVSLEIEKGEVFCLLGPN